MRIEITVHALDRWVKRHGGTVEELQRLLDTLPESKVRANNGHMMRFKGVSMVIKDGLLITVGPK